MNFSIIPADSVSLSLFIATVLFTISMILYGARRVSANVFKKTLLFISLWIVGMSLYVYSGMMTSYPFPALPLFFGALLTCAVFFGASRWGTEFLKLPLWHLVIFQCFRLAPGAATRVGNLYALRSDRHCLRVVSGCRSRDPDAFAFEVEIAIVNPVIYFADSPIVVSGSRER